MELKVRANTLELLPQKAVCWKEQKTLFISDLHLGKISHFRNHGIAVPGKALYRDFETLDMLIASCKPERIIIVGDLFHSVKNHEWELFTLWRKKYSGVEMIIVLGNHDILPRYFYEALPMETYQSSFTSGPFTFSHHPREEFEEGEFIIAGHVHPVAVLRGSVNQTFRFPCFFLQQQQLLLPSFGYFTGGYRIVPEEGDTVVAVANQKLIDVSEVMLHC